MASISSDTPGLQPPPGQTPNFDHPWSIRDVTLAFVVIFLVTSTLSTFARIYTRFFVSRNAGWDDYIMVLGWLGYVATWATSIHAFQYGAGTHQWDVRLLDVQSFAYWAFVNELMYGPVICLVKISICLQVLRLFVVTRGCAFWAIRVFIVVQLAWWFSNFWLNLFQCSPVKKGYAPQFDGTCIPNFGRYLIAVGVFNIASDILMWTFPLVCVLKLHLTLRKKLRAAAVFLIGLLAIVASVMRTIFTVRYTTHGEDATFVLTQFAISTQAEFFSGIVAGNSVTLPKFWTHIGSGFSSLRSLKSSKSSQRSLSSDQFNGTAPVVEHIQHIQNVSKSF